MEVRPASADVGELATEPTAQSVGGRYWVRTSDLFGVNEARYHCANRPLRGKETLLVNTLVFTNCLPRLDRDPLVVGDTGIEPVTSSVSGKRATAAPAARGGDGI